MDFTGTFNGTAFLRKIRATRWSRYKENQIKLLGLILLQFQRCFPTTFSDNQIADASSALPKLRDPPTGICRGVSEEIHELCRYISVWEEFLHAAYTINRQTLLNCRQNVVYRLWIWWMNLHRSIRGDTLSTLSNRHSHRVIVTNVIQRAFRIICDWIAYLRTLAFEKPIKIDRTFWQSPSMHRMARLRFVPARFSRTLYSSVSFKFSTFGCNFYCY